MTRRSYIIPCGLGLLAFGLFIRYHIGSRRFRRRNRAGLQQFPSFGRALWVTFIERIAVFIANLSITAAGSYSPPHFFTIIINKHENELF